MADLTHFSTIWKIYSTAIRYCMYKILNFLFQIIYIILCWLYFWTVNWFIISAIFVKIFTILIFHEFFWVWHAAQPNIYQPDKIFVDTYIFCCQMTEITSNFMFGKFHGKISNRWVFIRGAWSFNTFIYLIWIGLISAKLSQCHHYL